MFKTILLTAIVLAIALVGGAGSVWLALEEGVGFGPVTVGSWTAYPDRGTPQADPYSKARFAQDTDLLLGHAEGLTFTARADSAGEPLRARCDYVITGSLPPARFWTLHARDPRGQVISGADSRAPALHSLSLLREPDSTFSIRVSRNPQPGNWLAIGGGGPFTLVLTLYDTAIASSARIAEVELPRIVGDECDG
jgi:hypothetical protein